MSNPQSHDADGFTAAQRFRELARRILTTPKAELVKGAAKPKPTKHAAKKRKA